MSLSVTTSREFAVSSSRALTTASITGLRLAARPVSQSTGRVVPTNGRPTPLPVRHETAAVHRRRIIPVEDLVEVNVNLPVIRSAAGGRDW